MALTVEKLVQLSDNRAQRLERLAVKQGISENALVEKALDILFDLSEAESETQERKAWSALSLNAFARVWDNAADSVYEGTNQS